MHPRLLEAMRAQPAFNDASARLPAPGQQLNVGGLQGSAATLFVAALAQSLPQRLFIAVAAAPPEAEAIEADLHAYLGETSAVLYPQRETLPYEAAEHHLEVSGLRVEALEALFAGRVHMLITTPRALQELAEIPTGLADLRLTLDQGQTIRPLDLAEQLDQMGFSRTQLVEAVGEYALRGGILDLFGFGAPDPVRVEFWGDEIASIRNFDILDQRSTTELRRVDILPVDMVSNRTAEVGATTSVRRSLLDVLSRDAVLVHFEQTDVQEEFRKTWDQVLHLHDVERRRGGTPEPPDQLFLPPETALERLNSFGRVLLRPEGGVDVSFDSHIAEPIERDIDRLSALLRAGAALGEETFILCDNTGQLERLEELLRWGEGLPPHAHLAIGAVSTAFVLTERALFCAC
jgi:transcription-repair coupling factor (superfamily II helicase)